MTVVRSVWVMLAAGIVCGVPAAGQETTLPSPGGGLLRAPGDMVVRQMTITNADYKLFMPSHQYNPGMEQYPVTITEQEAADYARWAGKVLGKDLVWRPLPRGNRGIIYIVAEGTLIEQPKGEVEVPVSEPNMVYVPSGSFIMGSEYGDADEMPKYQAEAGPFLIDKYEVSNAEFRQQFPEFPFPAGQEDYPAVVTWEQAAAYAAKVGKRLPTEKEWEKAARGTDGRMFPWGDSFDYSFVSWDEKVPRGGAPARPESPYGCIDVAGGVWEWTADWYQPYPNNTSPSDAYGEKFKVLRGGATFNDVAMFRCSHRYYLPSDTTGNLRVGFRCVRDVTASAAK